jgi:hypothetical protein
MKAENDDGVYLPTMYDNIPERFYCRSCGYVPKWRQKSHEEDDPYRVAA